MSDESVRKAELAYRQQETPEHHAALRHAWRRAGELLPDLPLVSGPGWVLWNVRDGGRRDGRDSLAAMIEKFVLGTLPRHSVSIEPLLIMARCWGPNARGLAWYNRNRRLGLHDGLYMHAEKQRWIRLVRGYWVSVIDPCEASRGYWDALMFRPGAAGEGLDRTEISYSGDSEEEVMRWVAWRATLSDPGSVDVGDWGSYEDE